MPVDDFHEFRFAHPYPLQKQGQVAGFDTCIFPPIDRLLASQASQSDVAGSMVGDFAIAVLQKLEIVVDPGIVMASNGFIAIECAPPSSFANYISRHALDILGVPVDEVARNMRVLDCSNSSSWGT